MPSRRPDPAAQIVFDAYQRTTGPVAFLDESYQAPDGVAAHRDTFYVFTAVIVELDAMDELRVGIEDIADGTYWHTTKALQTTSGIDQTRDMLDFLADGHEACVIAHQIPVGADDTDAQTARTACYRQLAIELGAGRDDVWPAIDLFVLEERNQSNFRNKDKADHKALVSEKLIPRNTRLLSTSPRHEHLLWLPDLVSMAYRRTLTHTNSTSKLFDVIADNVHFVEVSEPEKAQE
ncbi:hypothetical protein ACKAMS_32455 [Rhodococcus sp. 5A-K4]|uniref:hypothetical protein n=1 Tax=Rhodococcus TaxID=1827 RepID=UPI00355BCAF5